MNFLFTPNHVQLLNSCYPPTSALLTSGPDYSPNSQELSRLTYYASNHPDKIAKLGSELEKRLRNECRKARSGNMRMRSSLLISLAILRSLVTECRRDIHLLSPSLITSVEATLDASSNDLEISARAASVFTAWTTYTDGHLIGTDSSLTKNYISCLRHFAALASSQEQDVEVRNRTRLVGLAALTGAVNSEALYNDSAQFRTQVSILLRPVLVTLFQSNLSTLEEEVNGIKDAPISPYLAEFRNRPVLERRAASIHLHIDGENGPSMSDVCSTALRTLYSLLQHINGSQLGHIMRSSFDNMDELNGWALQEHCCWLSRKMSDWSQYQYRYAVPTWLVERLTEVQDAPQVDDMHKVLIAMITTVFNSPTPLINLSTSDVLTNLMTVLIRRVSADPQDALPPALVECISSLGRHVYYSDQIQDLAGELTTRLLVVEIQGVVSRKHPDYASSRAQAIRCLLMGLLGLMYSAERNEPEKGPDHSTDAQHDRSSRRTRVPPDIWQDTLSLISDENLSVRADYAEVLVYYLDKEMPKQGDSTEPEFIKGNGLSESPMQQAALASALLHTGDSTIKLLHALHSYLYVLMTAPSLEAQASPSESSSSSPHNTLPALNIQPATPLTESHSIPLPPQRDHTPRSRKLSMAFRLLQHTPPGLSGTVSASLTDYGNTLEVLTTIHEQLPIRGLITGVPMLLALDGACDPRISEAKNNTRLLVIKAVLAKVWLVIGKTWNLPELRTMAEEALSSLPQEVTLPKLPSSEIGTYHSPREPTLLPSESKPENWTGVDAEKALLVLVSSTCVQEATGLDHEKLLSCFSKKWTAESALKESVEKPSTFDATLRGDGVSPLIKLTPGLMHIDNFSLASLARSTRGVGVTDLREALEGRSSMSNPALARPSSISTLDHTSSIMAGDHKLVQTRSRSRNKQRVIPSGSGEVRDVLNKLGLGKQNGSLLKASFPSLQQQ
ncbi:cellular morphogenesis-related protein [Moniliophthora roreri MCA 2997]|uniref:Cellular morphogenesis-related protein n=1 Tax=Moniliophthora roreri (strain MCA 2997) TaxID=1381753 RepID=V2XKY1_MONRO|nr:cellular morphogenesis-related protein [Moniliophthora roreri MCA 2997]